MKEESFEEQFPELKDFDVSNYVGLHGIINDVAIKELIQSCCLSKKRVKEAIEKLKKSENAELGYADRQIGYESSLEDLEKELEL
jgi:hypothetical protein